MNLRSLEIHSDIRQAKGLPGWVYSSEEVFEQCKEKLFPRVWHPLAEKQTIGSRNGFVYPCKLMKGCLDEPLIISRDIYGKLHCLSNVSTHRGHILVRDAGMKEELRCRYSGTTYDLGGTCLNMPGVDQVQDSDHLPGIPMEGWEKWLFGSLNPAFSVNEWTSEVSKLLTNLPMLRWEYRPNLSQDMMVRANWALCCDNYLEGLHVPFINPGLAGQFDFPKDKIRLLPYGVIRTAIARPGEQSFGRLPDCPAEHKKVGAFFCWLFPNILLTIYPWGMLMVVLRPLGPKLTMASYNFYGEDRPELAEWAAQIKQTGAEDERALESMQEGVGSRLYNRGRYVPEEEAGLHHFHRLLLDFLKKE